MRQAAISEAIVNAALTMGYAKVRQSQAEVMRVCARLGRFVSLF